VRRVLPEADILWKSVSSANDPLFRLKRRKAPPHEFVLEALTGVITMTRPMFGCLALYVGPKIVLILRDKPVAEPDNGVWLATTCEHHESLRRDFPNMRSVAVLGKEVTGWQVLAVDTPDFEEAALRACELVIAGDPRIGKIPKSKTRASKAMGVAGTRKAGARKSTMKPPARRTPRTGGARKKR